MKADFRPPSDILWRAITNVVEYKLRVFNQAEKSLFKPITELENGLYAVFNVQARSPSC